MKTGKLIAIIMVTIGGVMVYAGINKDNPLNVLKGVLQGNYIPKPSSTFSTSGSTTMTPGSGSNPNISNAEAFGAVSSNGTYTIPRAPFGRMAIA